MRVATVICAYTPQRWDLLRGAVASVEDQDQEGTIVVVIDHHDELLRRARSAWPSHHVVANRFARGLSGARNTGVAAAAGSDVIAFLDDDAWAHRGWLRELVAPFADPTVGLAGGDVEPAWDRPPPRWLPAEFLWVVGCSYVGLPTCASDIRNPIGASMAVRRAVFEAAGGFSNGLGRIGRTPLGCEETEFAIRASRHGFRSRYAPAARVSHRVPGDRATWRYFLRRCHAEGLSKAVVARLAGSGPGLRSERRYVSETLVLGARREMRGVVRGPHRGASAARAVAIGAGLGVTTLGYVRGRLASPAVDATTGPQFTTAPPADVAKAGAT